MSDTCKYGGKIIPKEHRTGCPDAGPSPSWADRLAYWNAGVLDGVAGALKASNDASYYLATSKVEPTLN